MEYPNKDKYSDTIPDVLVKDPEKKDRDYYLKKAEHIWASYQNGDSGIWFSMRETFDKYRKYGAGDQPSELYKTYFAGEESNETPGVKSASDIDSTGGWTQTPSGKRKAYTNILFDVISPAPKIRSTIVGMLEKTDQLIRAIATDNNSGAEKEKNKYRAWVISQQIEFLRKFANKAGIPMQEPEFMPRSQQELDLFEAKGGFKPVFAKALEMINFNAFKQSDWEEIMRDLIIDAVDIGIMATKDYFCEDEKIVKTKYVDPDRSTIQWSRYRDFRDAEWAGEWYYVSIGELVNSGLDKDRAEELARIYGGYLGNPEYPNTTGIKESGEYGNRFDFFKVLVFDFQFVDVYGKKEMVKNTRQGKRRVIPMDYSDKDVDNENTKTRTKEVRYLCGGKLVVGSDYIYEYGKLYDQVRPDKRNVRLTYHFYKLPSKSITEQLYPLYDNFMILWIKYQNAIQRAVASGYVIDTKSLAGNKSSGKNQEKDILKKFLQTGILLVNPNNSFINKSGRATLPVSELRGGMGQMFTDVLAGFQHNISMVEQLTGLNPLTLGSSPAPNAPVKTSEISVMAANNVLSPISSSIMRLKKYSAENISNWAAVKIRAGVTEGYSLFLSKADIQAIVAASKNNRKYNIFMEPNPSLEMKEKIHNAAEVALHNGRNGQAGINLDQYFSVMNIIENGGSLELAQMILENSISRNEEKNREYEMATAQNAQKNEMEKKQAELQSELAQIKAKGKEERLTEYTKAVLEVYVKNPDQQTRDLELRELDSLMKRIEEETKMKAQQSLAPVAKQPAMQK